MLALGTADQQSGAGVETELMLLGDPASYQKTHRLPTGVVFSQLGNNIFICL